MDIRPQDLPELRAEIVDCISQVPSHEPWEEAIKLGYTVFAKAKKVPTAAEHVFLEQTRLRLGELFYASPEMSDLAKAAAASLPEFELEPEDLPARSGFIVFGGAVEIVDFGNPPIASPVAAICWHTQLVASREVVWLSFYSHRDTWLAEAASAGWSEAEVAHNRSLLPRLTPMIGADTMWPFHADGVVHSGQVGEGFGRAARTLRAAWLLMQQPVAAMRDVEPDRASRKRLRRAGQEPAAVRVIELCRPKTSTGDAGASGREYHHRWITRGHWRQQWYPARQVHRPVWIAPHLKGPEGAPLIGGEKVYAWTR